MAIKADHLIESSLEAVTRTNQVINHTAALILSP